MAGVILPLFLFTGVEAGRFIGFAYIAKSAGFTLPGGVLVGLALTYVLRGRPTHEHSQQVVTPFRTLRTHAERKVFDFAILIGAVVGFGWTFLLAHFAHDPAVVTPRSVWVQMIAGTLWLGWVSTRISPFACKRLRRHGYTNFAA